VSSRHFLSSPPGFHLPDLRDVVDGVGVETVEPTTLESTYHDTSDLRLARAGAILRYRSDDGWLVRFTDRDTSTPAPPAHGDHRFDSEPGRPPEDALDLVRALVRTARVVPVARLRTLRRRVELHDEIGKPLGEVVDDQVTVLDRGRVAARFRELEVEVDDAAPDGLADAVATRLVAAGAGPSDQTPKVVRALGWRALEPPDVTSLVRLPPSPSAGDVVRAALAASVAQLIAHDPGVRLGDDPEDVHQARVASRRLRSSLRTFRDLLDPDWTKSLRTELKGLGRELGGVRDTDVLLERLRDRVERLGADDRDVAKRIINRLLERWDTARSALQETLRRPGYTELLDRLVDAARQPALVPEADGPAETVLPPLVSRPWKHLRRTVEELDIDPPDHALHEVRIRAKHCRYAAETVAPVVGKPARAFARAVEDLQEVLGEHQDAVVAERWLREVASDSDAPEIFVAGQLAGLERSDIERTRDAWPEVWRKASRKKLRQWF